jgi:Secretion system C-terminal sorting domain/PKD-like domain
MPIQFLSKSLATLQVVPLPLKISKTTSPNQFLQIQPRGYREISLTTYCRTRKDAQGNWLRENIKTIRYNIWIGRPDDIDDLISGTPTLCNNYTNLVNIHSVAGAATYRWFSVTPELNIWHDNGTSAALTIFQSKGGNQVTNVGFIVVAGNECSTLPENVMEIVPKPTDYTYRYFTMDVVPDYSCFRTIGGGTDEPKADGAFTGYPNPASSSYTISSDSKQKAAFSYKVFNSIGTLLTEGSSETGENAVVQVSNWADGIYTVLIQTENGVQALKLAVQKGKIAD